MSNYTLTQDPRNIAEAAILAYLQETFGADPAFVSDPVFSWLPGQSDQDSLTPYLTVFSQSCQEVGADNYRASMEVMIATSLSEAAAMTSHMARVGMVLNYLQFPDEIMAAVNKPSVGPDNRTVKDFRLLGMVPNKETKPVWLGQTLAHLITINAGFTPFD